MRWRCRGRGQEATDAGGRKSWKSIPSYSLFPFYTTASVFLTSPLWCRSKAISPHCCRPISLTLPTCLYPVHLSLLVASGPPFLLLLCPSLSACLPPPLFPLLLSPHDTNRKGRLCSPREIYCLFQPFHGFSLFLSMGLSTPR